MTGIAVSASVRERWRMGVEARALLLLTAALLAFGLVTVYSASAVVAVQADKPNWYYFVRQLSGVLAGLDHDGRERGGEVAVVHPHVVGEHDAVFVDDVGVRRLEP